MKNTDIECPVCGANTNEVCHQLVSFTNKATGEKKMEWRPIPEIHKERKHSMIMVMLRTKKAMIDAA
jgi:hypothetical protein